MKIIVNNNGASSIIDTGDANITEVIDMIVGALMQEGFHFGSIVEGFESKTAELESIIPKEQ
jgi:hypothetical protein